ncbi:MAG: hypothetical protein L3J43_03975 [Sulfurovum sp.]|nr:hypothetical protein [Sulfurovum sp.]
MDTVKHNTLTNHQQGIFDAIIGVIDANSRSILKTTCIEDYLLSLTGV